MTFTLIPGFMWFISIVSVVFAVTAIALLSAVVQFFTTHHRIRMERHQSIGHYYANLATGH